MKFVKEIDHYLIENSKFKLLKPQIFILILYSHEYLYFYDKYRVHHVQITY